MIVFMKMLFLIIPILVSVAFYTLLERKILSFVGVRMGPNKVSFMGILQPLMDAMKLMNKETNQLSNFTMFFYYVSSMLMLSLSMIIWVNLFSEPMPVSLKYSLLMFMIILSFNSFNSILAGWSTFSKYSLIGSIRTVTQLISYEAVLYLCFFFVIMIYSTFSFFNFNFMPFSMLFFFIPFCIISWIPSMLAELNRTPYDFSEGESELVSGFNVEFGSMSFTLIFLAEYMNIIFLSSITTFIFFFNNYHFILLMFIFVIWVRSVLPRFRFDKLMDICWKFFIPFLTFIFILCTIFF